jgi:ATP-dependent Clp protease ATP-binding subunit ClpC
MHDRPGGISPLAPIHVTELIERPIIAGRIQCIGSSTPGNFAKLQADGHWLAEYFEPIDVAPANEEAAIKVLQGIKGAYERFHNVSYTYDAIEHAVLCAGKYLKNRSLPGSAVDVIDEAGAAAQLERGSHPAEVVEVQKRIRFLTKRIEANVANHEFEKARSYSDEQRTEYSNLRQLREKYKLDKPDKSTLNVRREDIERAARKLVGDPDNSDLTS